MRLGVVRGEHETFRELVSWWVDMIVVCNSKDFIPVDSSGPKVIRPRITRGVGLEAMRGILATFFIP